VVIALALVLVAADIAVLGPRTPAAARSGAGNGRADRSAPTMTRDNVHFWQERQLFTVLMSSTST
jgi:hypothetical protein